MQKRNPPITRRQLHCACARVFGSCRDGPRPPSRTPDLRDRKWHLAWPLPLRLPRRRDPQRLFSGTVVTDKYCPGQERSSVCSRQLGLKMPPSRDSLGGLPRLSQWLVASEGQFPHTGQRGGPDDFSFLCFCFSFLDRSTL